MIKIAIWDDMSQCTEEEVKRMMPLVNEQRRQQAAKYKHLFGQYCCLRSWLMLRNLLGHAPNEWRYNEHGKPFLVGEDTTTYFSISHCREAIAVVIADQEVGIDIESIRAAKSDLVTRVMNEAEQTQIYQSADPNRTFTRLWTQKEAIVKWQGIGIQGMEKMSDVRCQMLDVRCTMYDVRCTMYDVRCTKDDVRCGMSDVRCGMSDVGCETIEKEKYIYTIIYGKLHCISAEI